MSSYKNNYMQRNFSSILTHEVFELVAAISEYKGKEGLYSYQSPEILKRLQGVATIQSTESSNRIEGIVVNGKRLKKLMAESTTPQNRSENELAAYRMVLSQIHASAQEIPITPNLIKQLHGMLYKFSPGEGGHFKINDNAITERQLDGKEILRFSPTPAFQTNEAMSDLCTSFSTAMEKKYPHPLIAIGAFVLDFLCIHPFRDGNGRMARLLTLLSLYHAGYEVGRFISLEKIIEDTKDRYYATLHRSSQGWHEDGHQLVPWLEYFLGVILAAYKEFENRAGLITDGRGQKSSRIREMVKGMLGSFTAADIEERCPDIARPTINAALKKMSEEGIVLRDGMGRSAKWRVKSH
ncbi:Fic family protein [Paenibacillus sp. IHBB 10380]|uniref:Fic family protein n=1 Tax=Paenibacillus sp. IHBB 10380 TaxID=1566358 RepID=UPI0005CFEFD0|nr:Fic family protein [Paenibacillus sp. IHBB 10380]AJS60868.1 cell division protein Fic [Paenibacillus sp. IHBB 10380]